MDVRSVTIPAAAVVLSGLLSGLLSGCGSGDETLDSSTSESLRRQVNAIRVAVEAGREPLAESAVANLRASISRLASSGELNAADGVVLLAQVDRIAAGIQDKATPTPTPKPTPKPTPAPVVDSGGGDDDDDDGGGDDGDNGKGNGKGNGETKGKGKGKD